MANYTLGLDLGVQSVGWAVVPDEISDEFPIKLGVRCFDSGTGTESEIEQGKDESRNKARRDARLIRRQQWRRKRKNTKLLNLLKRNGLLPVETTDSPEDRVAYFQILDKQLHERYPIDNEQQREQILPYFLRALALDEKLEPYTLGRALYHLGQRRGFLSNKKTGKDKEEGVVKTGISELREEMERHNARTLGEFFSTIDPEKDTKRIRQRYTHRSMFTEEFNAICDAQQRYYGDLFNTKVIVDSGKSKKHNEPLKEMTLREAIYHCLFFQRPLKSQKGLIGRCDLEPSKRRAPIASLEFQRFRYWQKLFDLTYKNEDGLMVSLTQEQRNTLAEKFEQVAKMTYSQIRTALGFKQPKQSKEDKGKIKPIYSFNFEFDAEDSEKGIKGNITASKIRKVISNRWDEMSEEQQTSLVDEMLQFADEEALARRLVKAWKFDITTATALAALDFEPAYGSLSRLAIRKILPYMQEKQISFATARKEIYEDVAAKIREVIGAKEWEKLTEKKQIELINDISESKNAENLQKLLVKKWEFDEDKAKALSVKIFPNKYDFLPPIKNLSFAPRNPVVIRTLTEVRKIVNAIIRQYGKPERIRIEMARDMKNSRKQREEIFKEQRKQEKKRDEAKANILREMNNGKEPRPIDILKVLLAEECNWQCPYTGKTITYQNLLGASPQFDIEHTLPFSRSLDNRFVNKSLCDVHENRNVKKNQTPFEAYGSNPQRWHEILERVQRFQGKMAERKLNIFQLKEIPEGFVERHLNDTRYISRCAADYVALLYGGRYNDNEQTNESTMRMQSSAGKMTAWLRNAWNLNSVLNDGGEKNRDDHRHHAIDALVITFCDPKKVQQLTKAAELARHQELRKLFVSDTIPEPFDNFLNTVNHVVDEINISFRCNRRASGGFHKETNYSKPIKGFDKTGKQAEYRHVRKPIASMTENEINNIVDDRIREIVQEKLKVVGGISKIKLLAEKEHCPHFITRDGRAILIKKSRYRQVISVLPIGKGTSERFVTAGSNHHMEIFSILDESGNEIDLAWKVVSLFEAYQRLKQKQPIISHDNGPVTRLKFSLAKGESVMATIDDEDVLLKVCKISEGDLSLCDNRDSRVEKERAKTGDFQKYRIQSTKKLKQLNIRKVIVDLLGHIHPAND